MSMNQQQVQAQPDLTALQAGLQQAYRNAQRAWDRWQALSPNSNAHERARRALAYKAADAAYQSAEAAYDHALALADAVVPHVD